MGTFEKEIFDFLDDFLAPYKNKNGVLFELNYASGEEAVTVSVSYHVAIFEGERNNGLSVCCEGIPITVFIEWFSIHSLSDITGTAPEKLQCLYENGKAHYWCFVKKDSQSLTFTKFNGGFYVRDFASGDAHILSSPLDAPESFFGYTKQYFQS